MSSKFYLLKCNIVIFLFTLPLFVSNSQTLIKDIIPGPGSANAKIVGVTDRYVYYIANTENSSVPDDLYVHNISLNTLEKIYSVEGNAQYFDATSWFRTMGDLLLFTHDDYNYTSRLFRSDGTTAGTFQLPLNSNDPPFPDPVTTLNHSFYFKARVHRTSSSPSLIVTDGTISGTKNVNVENTNDLFFPVSGGKWDVRFNQLFIPGWQFGGPSAYHWVSGNTAYPLPDQIDFYMLGNGIFSIDESQPQVYDGFLNDTTWVVYMLDTEGNTTLLKTETKNTSENVGFAGLMDYQPDQLLYYIKKDKGNDTHTSYIRQIISTGKTDTLLTLKEVQSTSVMSDSSLPFTLINARTRDNGSELILIDKTFSIAKFRDLNPGIAGSNPRVVGATEDFAFITAYTENGNELFVSDGVDLELKKIEVYPGEAGNSYSHVYKGGKLYFVADHPNYGSAIFVTDGTLEGTRLFYDHAPGNEGGGVADLAIVHDYLYFSADDKEYGYEPFRISLDYLHDNCSGITCPDGQICIEGSCYDVFDPLCDDVNCPDGQICYQGSCYDPYLDACQNVSCPNGQMCYQGSCYDSDVDLCEDVTCAVGEICKNGNCYPACAFNSDCPEGTVCMTDICVPIEEICDYTQCPENTVCISGSCYDPAADERCIEVNCPDGDFCYQGSCYSGVTNINESLQSEVSLTLFPNPTNGILMVKSEENMGDVDITIKDIVGRTIYQNRLQITKGETAFVANLHDAPAGYKMIEFRKNGKLIYKSAVVLMPR